MNQTAEFQLTIDPAHPSLAGHFPGTPVLPAVVLLDLLLDRAEQWLGSPLIVSGLRQAKFMSPVRPGDTVSINLRSSHDLIDFEVHAAGAIVASGSFRTRRE